MWLDVLPYAIVLAIFVLSPILAYRSLAERRDLEAFLRERDAKKARARSARVAGKILSIERTGVSINDQPEVRFRVDARLLDGREIELKFERIVDTLQIPRIQPGMSLLIEYDPEDPENNWTIDLDASPDVLDAAANAAPAPTSAPSLTGAPLTGPLWTFGLKNADAWLLPPRGATLVPLVMVDLADPHAADEPGEREAIVDSAAHLVSEALWTQTDIPASSVVWVDVTAHRVVEVGVGSISHEKLEPFLRSLDRAPIAVWGEGGRDLASDGITLKVRLPGDPAERTFSGPLAEVIETLIGWLVGRKLCQRVVAPRWYAAPTDDLLPLYARMLDNLQLQILADDTNKAIPRLSPESYHACLDQAFAAITKFPRAGRQLALIAAVTARFVRRAECLDEPRRRRALALITGVSDADDPLTRLAPRLLAELGEQAAALQRRQALAIGASGEYAGWLQRLADPE
jgi:hypothetical protein